MRKRVKIPKQFGITAQADNHAHQTKPLNIGLAQLTQHLQLQFQLTFILLRLDLHIATASASQAYLTYNNPDSLLLIAMKVFLNGEEFYYRLRDLLQTNEDLSSYKFNNKYHAITKDFDSFLDTTVRKYVEAYNKLPLVREEKEELVLENAVLKEKVHSLTQMLGQKDSIIKGVELLVKEKDQLISQLELGKRAWKGKQQGSVEQAEREGFLLQIQQAKAQNISYVQRIQKLLSELEEVEKEKESKEQILMCGYRRDLKAAIEALEQQHRKQIKAVKFMNEEKISSLNDQIWYLGRKCEEWRQKYKDELGFNVLAESQQ